MKLQVVVSAQLVMVAATFQAHRGFVVRPHTTLSARGEEVIVKNYNVLTPKRPIYSGRFPEEIAAPQGQLPPLPPVQAPPAAVVVVEPPAPPAVIVQDIVPPTPEAVAKMMTAPPAAPVTSIPDPLPLSVPSTPATNALQQQVHSATITPSSGSSNPYLERMRDNHHDFVKLIRETSDDDAYTLVDWPVFKENVGKLSVETNRAIQDAIQHVPAEQLKTSLVQAARLLGSKGLSQESSGQIWDALNTKDLGSWYIGIISAIVLSVAMASQPSYDTPATEAEALPVPVETAAEPVLDLSNYSMEQQVLKLTEATMAISKELKELKLTLAERDYTIATMQSDFRVLQNELSSLKTVERDLQAKVKKADKDLAAKAAELEKERSLRISLEEKASGAPRAKASPVTAPAPTPVVVAPTPEPAKVAAPMETPAPVVAPAAASKGSSKTPEESPAPVKATETMEAKAPKKAASKKAAKTVEAPVVAEAPAAAPKAAAKKAPAKKTSKASVAVPEPFFMAAVNGTDTVSTPKVAPKSAPAVANDDWSKFSPSTLSRKTISELTDYLIAKGVSVMDSKGKSMKKADLVQAVLTM